MKETKSPVSTMYTLITLHTTKCKASEEQNNINTFCYTEPDSQLGKSQRKMIECPH